MFRNLFNFRYLVLVLAIALVLIYFSFYFLISNSNPESNLDLINQILSQNSTSDSVTQKNIELKHRITANLIPNQPQISTTFEIDTGVEDGVEIGNAVTNKNGQLLGVVVASDTGKSTIQMVTNPAFKIPVWIKNNQNKGLLSGLYSYSAEVDWISDGTQIEGLPVYTTNINPKTAPNILIGYSLNPRIGKSGSFFLTNIDKIAQMPNANDFVLVW